MILGCIASACASGVMILGLLIMTRVVDLEDVFRTIGEALLPILAVTVLLSIVRAVILAGTPIAILWLKRLLTGLLCAAAVAFAAVVLGCALRRFSPTRGREHGERKGEKL